MAKNLNNNLLQFTILKDLFRRTLLHSIQEFSH